MIMFCILALVLLRVIYCAGEIICERDWPRNTVRGLIIALLLLGCGLMAFGQAVRVDIPLLTSGPYVPQGGTPLPQALWLSNATVQICAHPATLSSCSYVTTYTDATAGTPCPPTQQLVALPGNTCSNNSGILANIGFWYAGGTVDYIVTSSYGTYGPFTVTGVNGGGAYISAVTTLPQTMAGPLNLPSISVGTGNSLNSFTSVTNVWHRQGTILTGNSGNQYSVQEPTVMYENNQFELWYTCGWTSENLCYATSTTSAPGSWTVQATNIVTNTAHGYVFKNGSTYYYYGAVGSTPASVFGRWHATSPAGPWTLDANNILPLTSGWYSQQTGNIFVWIEGGTWYALYEGLGSDTIWRTGEAQSADGLTWTPYGSNPVIEWGTHGGCGGPEMHKVGSTYYVWLQCAPYSVQPTDIFTVSAPAPTGPYTFLTAQPTLARQTADEGPGNFLGQVADASMVEVNGSTYMIYDATNTQSPGPSGGIHLNMAVAPYTIAQLVATPQGSGDPVGLYSSIADGPYGYFGPQWYPDGGVGIQPGGKENLYGRFDIGTLSAIGGTFPQWCLNCYFDPGGGVYRYTRNGVAANLQVDTGGGFFNLLMYPSGTANATVGTAVNTLANKPNGQVYVQAIIATSDTADSAPNVMKMDEIAGGVGRTIAYGPDASTVGTWRGSGAKADGSGTIDYINCIPSSSCTFTQPISVSSGATIIYRCTVAGTLRVGQLTSVSADCGTAVDTGLRTP